MLLMKDEQGDISLNGLMVVYIFPGILITAFIIILKTGISTEDEQEGEEKDNDDFATIMAEITDKQKND